MTPPSGVPTTPGNMPRCWPGKGLTHHRHLGDRDSFADIAATISEYFGLQERYQAKSFLTELEELT